MNSKRRHMESLPVLGLDRFDRFDPTGSKAPGVSRACGLPGYIARATGPSSGPEASCALV